MPLPRSPRGSDVVARRRESSVHLRVHNEVPAVRALSASRSWAKRCLFTPRRKLARSSGRPANELGPVIGRGWPRPIDDRAVAAAISQRPRPLHDLADPLLSILGPGHVNLDTWSIAGTSISCAPTPVARTNDSAVRLERLTGELPADLAPHMHLRLQPDRQGFVLAQRSKLIDNTDRRLFPLVSRMLTTTTRIDRELRAVRHGRGMARAHCYCKLAELTDLQRGRA